MCRYVFHTYVFQFAVIPIQTAAVTTRADHHLDLILFESIKGWVKNRLFKPGHSGAL